MRIDTGLVAEMSPSIILEKFNKNMGVNKPNQLYICFLSGRQAVCLPGLNKKLNLNKQKNKINKRWKLQDIRERRLQKN